MYLDRKVYCTFAAFLQKDRLIMCTKYAMFVEIIVYNTRMNYRKDAVTFAYIAPPQKLH